MLCETEDTKEAAWRMFIKVRRRRSALLLGGRKFNLIVKLPARSANPGTSLEQVWTVLDTARSSCRRKSYLFKPSTVPSTLPSFLCKATCSYKREERRERRTESCPEVRDHDAAGPRKDWMRSFFSAVCSTDTHRYHRCQRCADAVRSVQSRLHSTPPTPPSRLAKTFD